MSVALIEGMLVALLFIGYAVIWRIKQRQQFAETGENPEVIYHDTRPSQQYFAGLSRLMSGGILLLISLHMLGIQDVPGFYRIKFFDTQAMDGAGFMLGIAGLLLCRVAQQTMGTAWRVGIDQQATTPLVTTGMFAYIRNPTYSGLFMLCIGAWIILPSLSILTWCLVFFVMIEFQVRNEEEFLLLQHEESYAAYCAKTKRYIPFIY